MLESNIKLCSGGVSAKTKRSMGYYIINRERRRGGERELQKMGSN